jgi:hypothetical protein
VDEFQTVKILEEIVKFVLLKVKFARVAFEANFKPRAGRSRADKFSPTQDTLVKRAFERSISETTSSID